MVRPFHRRITRSTPLLILATLLIRRAAAQYVPPATGGEEFYRRGTRFAGLDGRFAERGVEGFGLVERNEADQSSTSRFMYLISHTDFCLFGPPSSPQKISETNRDVVSWCTSGDHGNRLIPDGTLHGVTYVKADNWVQVSGTGDFTNINIASGVASEGGLTRSLTAGRRPRLLGEASPGRWR
ncbi:hypothetical protein IAT38_007072 [Cryptococcus sp. DSM 104549]